MSKNDVKQKKKAPVKGAFFKYIPTKIIFSWNRLLFWLREER